MRRDHRQRTDWRNEWPGRLAAEAAPTGYATKPAVAGCRVCANRASSGHRSVQPAQAGFVAAGRSGAVLTARALVRLGLAVDLQSTAKLLQSNDARQLPLHSPLPSTSGTRTPPTISAKAVAAGESARPLHCTSATSYVGSVASRTRIGYQLAARQLIPDGDGRQYGDAQPTAQQLRHHLARVRLDGNRRLTVRR